MPSAIGSAGGATTAIDASAGKTADVDYGKRLTSTGSEGERGPRASNRPKKPALGRLPERSKDGRPRKISVAAPPGRMGLSLQFVGACGRVMMVHPACQFRSEVAAGDVLHSIDGKIVRAFPDASYHLNYPREIVFVREVANSNEKDYGQHPATRPLPMPSKIDSPRDAAAAGDGAAAAIDESIGRTTNVGEKMQRKKRENKPGHSAAVGGPSSGGEAASEAGDGGGGPVLGGERKRGPPEIERDVTPRKKARKSKRPKDEKSETSVVGNSATEDVAAAPRGEAGGSDGGSDRGVGRGRDPRGAEYGGARRRRPKRPNFLPCGECAACTRPNCGECENCLKKPAFGGSWKGSWRRCSRRACGRMATKDGRLRRITASAPPGMMGLGLQLQFVNALDDVHVRVMVVHPSCKFRSEVEPGDILYSTEGRHVRSLRDADHRLPFPRELVFVREVANPVPKEKEEKPKDYALPENVWETPEAAKAFDFGDGSEDVKRCLEERLDLLRAVNRREDGYKAVVGEEGTFTPYTGNDIMIVRHRALILARAYLLALERMNVVWIRWWREDGRKVSKKEAKKTKLFTWGDCCDEAARELNALGVEPCTSRSAVRGYHKMFATTGLLMTKKMASAGSLLLFERYPLLKSMIVDFVTSNKEQMSIKMLEDEIADTILPAVLEDAQDNGNDDTINTPEFELLVKVTSTPPGDQTVRKWVQVLGLKLEPSSGSCRGKDNGQTDTEE